MIVTRPIYEPIRQGLSYEQLWKAEDNGLIACWENGRELAKTNPALAEQAKAGRLPPLDWKGGVNQDKPTKAKKKTGTHRYLARWQGLRGDDLAIDCESKPKIKCTHTEVVVTFSGKYEDYANA